MNLNSKQKLKVLKIIQAFGNQYFIGGEIKIDYGKKIYYDLASILYEIPELRKVYDEDLAVFSVKRELENRFKNPPIILDNKILDEILEGTLQFLNYNTQDHLIVVPIQSAQFDKLIKFHSITLIPKHFSRDQKLKVLARLSKRKLKKTRWILQHTEKTRSPDFLKYPLLCFKQKHQTHSIHYNALNIARVIIYSLRCFYFSKIWNQEIDKTKSYFTWAEQAILDPTHLLILAEDDWRLDHKPLHFDVNFPYDLRWLENKTFQNQISRFLDKIYFESSFDDFDITFLNAIYLFNDSLKQNRSISTLLLMTIAESILARNKNEKRLRVSALIVKVIKTPKDKRNKISKLFHDLYIKRNSFVHNAEDVTILSNFEAGRPNDLEIARKVIADLILSYDDSDKLLSEKLKSNATVGKVTKLKLWSEWLEEEFNSIIFGT